MGKQSCILLVILLLQLRSSFATANFGEQKVINIYNKTQGPSHVCTSDIDNDGFLDIIVADRKSYKTLWYKNNGDKTFSTPIVIDSTEGGSKLVSQVYAGDLDGDGDNDILCSWEHPAEYAIAWYRNDDGKGNFSDAIGIRNNEGNECHSMSVFAKDIDGDTDLDVIYAIGCNDEIAWHENRDGNGTFGEKRTITTELDNVHNIFITDLDQDNDPDIVASSDQENEIVWFKNTDGSGIFSEEIVISATADNAWGVHAVDLDNDNDVDVLYCGFSDGSCIAWFENIDGSFSSKKDISTQLNNPLSICAGDLDADGDNDVLCTSYDRITFHENIDSQGTFGSQQIITSSVESARSIFASDLDNDGDLDVLSVSQNDNKVAWYENLTISMLVNDENPSFPGYFQLYQNYPNPFNPSTTISFILQKSEHISLKIYNIAGQEVVELINGFQHAGEHQVVWQTEGLASGIYFVRLQAKKRFRNKKLVLQK